MDPNVNNFIATMSSRGIQIASRFEVQFDNWFGDDLTFYAQSIGIPNIVHRMGSIFFGGREVQIPILAEYGHDITITFINDSSGQVYPWFVTKLASTMSVKPLLQADKIILTAIGDSFTQGLKILLNNVYITSVSELQFGQSSNDMQTFTVQCWVRDFTFEPGIKQDGGIEQEEDVFVALTGEKMKFEDPKDTGFFDLKKQKKKKKKKGGILSGIQGALNKAMSIVGNATRKLDHAGMVMGQASGMMGITSDIASKIGMDGVANKLNSASGKVDKVIDKTTKARNKTNSATNTLGRASGVVGGTKGLILTKGLTKKK